MLRAKCLTRMASRTQSRSFLRQFSRFYFLFANDLGEKSKDRIIIIQDNSLYNKNCHIYGYFPYKLLPILPVHRLYSQWTRRFTYKWVNRDPLGAKNIYTEELKMGKEAVFEFIKKKQLVPLLRLYGMSTPFYRLGYIAALVSNGCIQVLKEKSASLDELMSTIDIEKEYSEEVKAWLQVGIRLGEISLKNGKYRLSGISKDLASIVENEALLAIIEEIAMLHHNLILRTPAKLMDGRKWTINDQDGEMIARSSRILEPFQNEVINTMYPRAKSIRLLEVGCGSGIYIKHAAMRYPQLKAVGVELQAPVVEMARHNIEKWGLQDQVKIESGDIREKNFPNSFDLVTLYNNIYYFPVGERIELLKHLRSFLKQGGSLILTTGCQGGTLVMELLNLWGATTQGCVRLPYVKEMVSQMKNAGFENIKKKNLLPGDAFYVFKGVQAI